MKEKLEKIKGSLSIISWDCADEKLRKHAVNSLALIDEIVAELESPELLIEIEKILWSLSCYPDGTYKNSEKVAQRIIELLK